MDVVVSGSSGLIGRALEPALKAAGHRPIRLVRRAPAAGADEIRWQPDAGEIDADALNGVGAAIHLAGAGIGDKRWNDAYKRTLLESRTVPTRLLATTLAGLDRPPARFLSASAIGIYGDRGDEVLTEQSPPGRGFLSELVVAWEAASQPAADAGISTANLRTGLVMTAKGGVLPKMALPIKLGVGGRLGSGRQYQSWITLTDEVAAIVHLLTSSLTGPVNLTAPNPVTNAELTRAMGQALHRPTLFPVPAFGPKLLLGSEMATELLFSSQRVRPEALLADGFTFTHTDPAEGVKAALADR